MYKTGALVVNSSKLLLPALAAAARVVSGVLYVPLDYVERTVGTGPGGAKEEGGGGGRGEMVREEERSQVVLCETRYLQEASQQVGGYMYLIVVIGWCPCANHAITNPQGNEVDELVKDSFHTE